MRVRIYDNNEVFKRDFSITCTCSTSFISIALSINPFYANPIEAAGGTYTELTSVPAGAAINAGPRTSFYGYTQSYTVGSIANSFFGRLQNGSQLSIDGPAVVSER